jgi:hypothetical protein
MAKFKRGDLRLKQTEKINIGTSRLSSDGSRFKSNQDINAAGLISGKKLGFGIEGTEDLTSYFKYDPNNRFTSITSDSASGEEFSMDEVAFIGYDFGSNFFYDYIKARCAFRMDSINPLFGAVNILSFANTDDPSEVSTAAGWTVIVGSGDFATIRFQVAYPEQSTSSTSSMTLTLGTTYYTEFEQTVPSDGTTTAYLRIYSDSNYENLLEEIGTYITFAAPSWRFFYALGSENLGIPTDIDATVTNVEVTSMKAGRDELRAITRDTTLTNDTTASAAVVTVPTTDAVRTAINNSAFDPTSLETDIANLREEVGFEPRDTLLKGPQNVSSMYNLDVGGLEDATTTFIYNTVGSGFERPDLIRLNNGNMMAIYNRNFFGFYASVFSSKGQVLVTSKAIDYDTNLDGMRSSGDLLRNGNIAVAWTDGSYSGMNAAIIDSTAEIVIDIGEIYDANTTQLHTIALKNGGFAILTAQQVKIFNSSGSLLQTVSDVSTTGDTVVIAGIAQLENGNIIVLIRNLTQGNDLYYSEIDLNGTLLEDTEFLASANINSMTRPRTAPNGSIAVLYKEATTFNHKVIIIDKDKNVLVEDRDLGVTINSAGVTLDYLSNGSFIGYINASPDYIVVFNQDGTLTTSYQPGTGIGAASQTIDGVIVGIGNVGSDVNAYTYKVSEVVVDSDLRVNTLYVDASSVVIGNTTITEASGGGGILVDGTEVGGGLFEEDANDNIVGGTGAGDSFTTGARNFIAGVNAAADLDTQNDGVYIGHETARYLDSLGGQNIVIGSYAGYGNATDAIGYNACVIIGVETGFYNEGSNGATLVGYRAGRGKSGGANDGNRNTFVGYQSGYTIDTGDENVALGAYALYTNEAAHDQIAIGTYAAYDLTAQTSPSVFVGYEAARYLESGFGGNVVVGYRAGRGDVSGTINYYNNVLIGQEAYRLNQGGDQNVVIGSVAMYAAQNVSSMVVVGDTAAYELTVQSIGSVIIGYNASRHLESGTGANVIIGTQAGYGTSSGTIDYSYSVMIGYTAGFYNERSLASVFLGAEAGYGTNGGTNHYTIRIVYCSR